MKKNVGTTDKYIRLIGGIAIAALLFTNIVPISSLFGIILAVAGTIFLFTSFANWCAIYQVVGLSTCPTSPKQS